MNIPNDLPKNAYLHAKADTANLRDNDAVSHAPEPTRLEKTVEWLEKNKFYAIAREFVKDARNTVNQVFFGQPESPGEPGAPLNFTQTMATNEVAPDTYEAQVEAAAARGGGEDRDRGIDR